MSQRGFTILEIIIAVGITAMVLLVVTSFQRNVFYYKTTAYNSLITAQDARSILRTMVAELRSASPSNNGSYPIFQAATNSLAFFSDIDGNGVKEQVRYFATGTSLYRGVIVPTGSPLGYATTSESLSLLDSNLRNGATSIFDYYDSTYSGSTTGANGYLAQPVLISAVRLVKITLVLDVDQNNAPVSRTYTSQATLRNLKDNL